MEVVLTLSELHHSWKNGLTCFLLTPAPAFQTDGLHKKPCCKDSSSY